VTDAGIDAWIGGIVRNGRLQRGVTQDDLAQLLQVDRSMVSRYERGRRTLSAPALIRIFAYLQLSLATLDRQPSAITGTQASPTDVELERVVALLAQRPDLLTTVTDVLETFLETEEPGPAPRIEQRVDQHS